MKTQTTTDGIKYNLMNPSSLVDDGVNSPSHYNKYDTEVIDMMIALFGKKKVKIFCEINAFKYRMRIGYKDDMVKDLQKEQWYLNKMKEL